jgi:hypothetical protein
MKNTCTLMILCGLVSLAAFLPREAGAQSRSDRDRDRVCVYQHAGYGGWEHCYGVGEDARDLGNHRNGISSVRIFGRAEITLFEHPAFQGNEVIIDRDISDLRELKRWNDQTDSLRVAAAGFTGRPRPGQRREDRVCVYQHAGYRGNSQCFDAGEDMPSLKDIGWNDGISSIRVFNGTRVAVYENSDYSGERLVVEKDIPDLTRMNARGGWNWNDQISSLRASGGRRGRRD